MDDTIHHALPSQAQARQRRRVAIRLQEIEGNPLTRDEIAMFEMFDREGWSPDARRAYITARIKVPVAE